MSNEIELTPPPADVWDRLDTERIQHGIASMLSDQDEAVRAIERNDLAWSLSGFDSDGMATVTVLEKRSGAHVATLGVHWSAITTDAA